jgi:hypothetical protein
MVLRETPGSLGRLPRWVLTGGGGFSDGRTGSRSVMTAVQETCISVDSVDGLYGCQGREAALAASTRSGSRLGRV